jgi:hypothetical protein
MIVMAAEAAIQRMQSANSKEQNGFGGIQNRALGSPWFPLPRE